MPKPVKKVAPKKPAAKKATKRPSSDPNRRAQQMLDAHMGKLDEGKWKADQGSGKVWDEATAPPIADVKAILSAHMSAIGRKGGKVSGAKRMEMPEKQRKEIARKAAKARWGRRKES